jgi:hypothetical protein
MEFAKSGECGKRNGHEVANTADIENDLIGTLIEKAAAEQSDHRMKVLPCCSDVSTHGRTGLKRLLLGIPQGLVREAPIVFFALLGGAALTVFRAGFVCCDFHEPASYFDERTLRRKE